MRRRGATRVVTALIVVSGAFALGAAVWPDSEPAPAPRIVGCETEIGCRYEDDPAWIDWLEQQ